MHSLMNTGARLHIVYDKRGKTVSIPPGATKPIDLDEAGAQRFRIPGRELQLVDGRTTVKTEVPAEKAKPKEKAEEPAKEKPADETPPPSGRVARKDKPAAAETEAQKLLRRLNDDKIDYFDFVEEAKILLGKKWPKGTPKKKAIVELLEGL